MGDGIGSSQFSTGGGGYEYEREVEAVYLATMYGIVAPVTGGIVTMVWLQQRNADYPLDGLVAVFETDDGTHGPSFQTEHSLYIGGTSAPKGAITNYRQIFACKVGLAKHPGSLPRGAILPCIADAPGAAARHFGVAVGAERYTTTAPNGGVV